MARGEERETMFLDVVQELGPGGCQPLWAALDRHGKQALRGTSKVRQPGLRVQGMPTTCSHHCAAYILPLFPPPQASLCIPLISSYPPYLHTPHLHAPMHTSLARP